MKNNRFLAEKIAEKVSLHGGEAYYVGGCVRDKILGYDSEDIDIEIHKIEKDDLEKILDSIGERIEIGKSFGIYNIKGYNVDIALPRKEICTGAGHRDFQIEVDPYLGTEKAARRRDFTVNALMEDVLSGEISDHFGGIDDIKNKIIRHIDDNAFGEDTLRVFRAAQFSARLGFSVAEETKKLCSKMDVSTLSCERVFEEMKKALLKAEKPSRFFENLYEMNMLDIWFPEVLSLKGVIQSREHHPEGDVWTHTMMVLDAAASLKNKAENPLGFMLCALCHDFGKITATKEIDGKIHSYGHEEEGLPIISHFLHALTSEKELIKYVLNLAKYHMKPNILAADNSSVKATNKMFDECADPMALIYISVADRHKNNENECFLLERYEIYKEYMSREEVCGKDLINMGIKPSEKFSEILKFTHKLHLAGVEKSVALKEAATMAKKLGNN